MEPSYSEITLREVDRASSIPSATTLLKDTTDEISDPSFAVFAMACSTEDRLELFTPVIPSSAKSSGVSAGEAVFPAATACKRSMMLAIVASFSYESMSEVFKVSTTEFISATSAELSMTDKPIN